MKYSPEYRVQYIERTMIVLVQNNRDINSKRRIWIGWKMFVDIAIYQYQILPETKVYVLVTEFSIRLNRLVLLTALNNSEVVDSLNHTV